MRLWTFLLAIVSQSLLPHEREHSYLTAPISSCSLYGNLMMKTVMNWNSVRRKRDETFKLLTSTSAPRHVRLVLTMRIPLTRPFPKSDVQNSNNDFVKLRLATVRAYCHATCHVEGTTRRVDVEPDARLPNIAPGLIRT